MKLRFGIWMLVGAAIAAAGMQIVRPWTLHESSFYTIGSVLYVVCAFAALFVAVASNFGRGRRKFPYTATALTESEELRAYAKGYSARTVRALPRIGPLATGFATVAICGFLYQLLR